VKFFSQENKPVFITGIPVMKKSFSLREKLHRENPVFITGMGLQCSANIIFRCNNFQVILEGSSL